ncbi:hypothetical protein ACFL35_13245 [Candidatus Riflebacteria bacterium]
MTRTDNKLIKKKGGIFLPLLFVVIGILLLFAFKRLFFARENINLATRLVNREILYSAAQGVLEIGKAQFISYIEAFNSGAKDLGSRRIFKQFHEKLLNKEGFIELKPLEIRIKSENFKEIVNSIQQDIHLDVLLYIQDIQPIFKPSTLKQSAFGKYERTFLVKIKSTASLGNYDITAVGFTQARLMLCHIPIFPKFTLFIKQKGNFKPNPIKALPIIFHHGQSLPKEKKLSSEKMSELLQRQGLIYLGGTEWKLGLSSKEKHGDLAAPAIPRKKFFYQIKSVPSAVGNFLRFYSTARGMFNKDSDPKQFEFIKNAREEQYKYSSSFNLFGSTKNPSPTLIIGRVKRKYVLEQGIYNRESSKTAPLPFIDQNIFNSMSWPGIKDQNLLKYMKNTMFGGSYGNYKNRMSTPVIEDFNIAVSALLDSKDKNDLKFTLKEVNLPRLKNIEINNNSVATMRIQLDKYLSLIDDKNELLFRGNPETFEMDRYLARKTCFKYKYAQYFLKTRLKKNILQIKGVEHVTDNLAITQSMTLKKGHAGILIADKHISIGAGINTPGGHLYIISRSGNIKIKTAQPISAYLVALKGKIYFPDNFNIRGGVAIKELANNSIKSGGGSKKITYNPGMDITLRKVRKKGYKFVLRDTWDFYVR